MRRLGGPTAALAALLALALGAPAPAQQTTAAQGTISGSGTSWRLSVLNTGRDQLQCLRFEAAPGVQVTGATGAGTVTPSPTGFSADGFSIPPDGQADYAFTTTAPYPENAGGTLFVSSTCQAGSDVQAPVTGPAPGAPAPAAPAPAPVPVPVRGESEVVEPISGVVRVRRRGTRRFVGVREGTLIPDGSEIDTRRGRLRLIVDRGDGTTESAEVSEGRAIVDQDTASRPTTTLRLSEPLACRVQRSAVAAATRKRTRRRRLFTHTDGGRFRTKGRYAAAVASGTAWRTIDACAFTLIRVVEGTVQVTALRSGNTVPVSAPHSALVRRPRR